MSRVSIVTGGTSGIGRGIAEKLLEKSGPGDLVLISYGHDEKRAERFLEELPAEKRELMAVIRADLSSYEAMTAFVQEVKARTERVDRLVCNVGVSTRAAFQEYTFEEWTKIINTNLSVPVFLVRELMPLLAEGGRVLFTGSYAGQQPYSSSLVYGVSKAAVHFLARSLVKELEPLGITVNAIAPGFIQTDWHRDRAPESYERIQKKIALHRFGTVSEVADMACAILENGYMNGSVVDIHGGYDYF